MNSRNTTTIQIGDVRLDIFPTAISGSCLSRMGCTYAIRIRTMVPSGEHDGQHDYAAYLGELHIGDAISALMLAEEQIRNRPRDPIAGPYPVGEVLSRGEALAGYD